jgi:hypothetical protein
MPFNPEARLLPARIFAWCRQQLLLFLFGALVFFQIMTWLEIRDIARDSPSCRSSNPCYVTTERSGNNDDYLARRIGEEVAKQFRR